MSGERVVILGALSAIAEETARLFAAEGAHLMLVARDAARLDVLAADLRLRGAAEVAVAAMDLAEAEDAQTKLSTWTQTLGGVDTVLLFYGALGDQARSESDLAAARAVLDVNFTSQALWSLAAAQAFEAQRRGSLVMVSSVAGDRGRMSNYVYGAAKGGLAILGQGIAHRLAQVGGEARAVVVKLGFVRTPMTQGFDRSGPLWADASTAAAAIHRAASAGGPVVYAPWFWRFVLLAIRLAPAAIFHKTRL
ncbi:MAG: SDR family NAD(P)-dependent oxidoreductase [Phenylobacterium sp.]|uniref:SDR family NAD(P)-dependent oxidoreductase n=1 Tax=Phenylobacterium sp. TaxID=1871053 RepID=UPI002732D4FB|nr:SDR family NAD(P)-dependent oxidoreductase [Phenylobacterium sp.]MDP3175698.1 SDR family NAD(P)-dependent oxidoreductase [Phenylobacterium sp.]